MSAFRQPAKENHAPDSPVRKINRKMCSDAWRTPNKNHPELNNNVLEVKARLVQDVNKNFQEGAKKANRMRQSLLCLKKPVGVSQERNTFRTLNVNALRADSMAGYYVEGGVSKSPADVCDRSSASSSRNETLGERQKNRNSFHQNVEEALSSLLWQPYEYQNTGKSSSVTSSSCSRSSSSSLADLEDITKNDGTPLRCSFTDLHLPTSASEMVINLPAKNPIVQWATALPSRVTHAIRPTSWLSEVASLAEVTDANVPAVDASDASINGSDMQVNVSTSSLPTTIVSSNAPAAAAADNGLRGGQNQQPASVYQTNLNLSSANVVGLPQHTRYASVPVSTVHSRPQAGSGIFPNHSRNVSEPSNQFAKYQNNGTPLVAATRHSSQVDQSNLQQINHFRSSSVPKSMPIVPRHESGTTATTTTTVPGARLNQKLTPPIHNNVSNVNVNFYRAVPVNVVSSVPTIQCLNSLSNAQGNSVSNVQVLPLGANQTSFPVTTLGGGTSFPTVAGTTQVILHNAQASTNSIQIPSNFQNVNRSTVLNPQIVPVQINRSTVSTSTNTSFLPLTPATSSTQDFIQNRPISTPTVTIQQNNNEVRARSYSNAAINTTPIPSSTQSRPAPRTLVSTEAQTDETSVSPPANNESSSSGREHRRRERRERRHQRRVNTASHRHTADSGTQINCLQNDRLPDLLNSHMPPPYTTLPNGMVPPPPPQMVPPQMLPPPPGAVLQSVVPNNVVPPSGFVFPPPPPLVVPGQVPLVQGPAPVAVPVPPPSGFRFPFPANGFRRGRFAEEPPKGCCGLLSWKPGSLRWFIALIALVAVCCVLVGTALGAMRPSGREHLTVSLLMIGVGIVLVTVSGVAWRLTSHDSSTCRSMLGLGSTESVDVCTRRFVPRLPPSYGRPHHPYAAMMYPEFQYRPPPPSYQASMQEYRLRLLLLDRGNTPQIQAGIQNAVSPPPTYRSHAGSLLRAPLSSRRDASQSEYSCPPSYRSQNSCNRPGTIPSNSVLHSREQSLSLSESNHGGSVVNVVNILGSTEEDIALDNITLDSLKMEPESELNPVKMLLKSGTGELEGSKDGNLVTIVQTSDQSPVIVTVSGSSQVDSGGSVQITEIPSEMEILAHL